MNEMIYKVGDYVSFNGQHLKTMEVFFSGLRRTIDPQFFNETHEIKVLVAQPHSKFRVKEFDYPYYICEKLWETGDEEIPINAQPVFIHISDIVPYQKEWEGTVTNKVEEV